LGTIFFILNVSLKQNKSQLIYGLDDAYIHMSLAKNIVQYGVLGVTRNEMSSAASSLLWPFLLAIVYMFFGVNQLAPLILNIFLSVLVVLVFYGTISTYLKSQRVMFFFLLLLLYCAPLISLVFEGMEHLLQILLAICFVYSSASIVDKNSKRREKACVLVLAFLLTAVRYEGFFLVGVVVLLFFARRRFLLGTLIAVLAVLPALIYAGFSLKQGWFVIPNSILLKSSLAGVSHSFKGIFFYLLFKVKNFYRNPEIVNLVIISLFLYVSFWKKKNFKVNLNCLAIFLGTAFLHVLLIRLGWAYRYEAYLIAIGLLSLSVACGEVLKEKESMIKAKVLVFLLVVLFLPLGFRGGTSLFKISQAMNNIYSQQYQMGRFLARYYHREAVAVNDIGAINYLADLKAFDLWGVGNIEITRLKLQGDYGRGKIEELTRARGIKIALLYEDWFQTYGGLPKSWIKVGEWKIFRNVVCGGDTVSFYATNKAEAEQLARNLEEFASFLPLSVSFKRVLTK